ncbi:hypothetical protein SDC9_84155 [bioreactor metagenome]|uniref:Uncharacterized protein n=1 Tax=bioreactor metagenome TaxID=1076179 RepID=A0A644ZA40_9ZZZZ
MYSLLILVDDHDFVVQFCEFDGKVFPKAPGADDKH